MGWKTWVKVFLGCTLLVVGAVAGFYQISTQPKIIDLLGDPFTGMNLLLLLLPAISVAGLLSGVWMVMKATE